MPRTILAICLLVLAACATAPTTRSTASAGLDLSETPARVVFRHVARGQTWALVNNAHTDRVELYSKERTDLSTKVVEDEVMQALIEYLEGPKGFHGHARPGPAPSGAYSRIAEVQVPGRSFHMAISASSPLAESQVFNEAQTNFLSLWNNVVQLQAVPKEFRPSPPPRHPGR